MNRFVRTRLRLNKVCIMKTPTRMVFVLLAALAWHVGITAPASAQEWSAAQKEVWKNVEAYWAADAAGNTEEFLTYFHADYSGWSLQNPLPGGKERARKFLVHGHKTEKTLLHDIQPVAIKIHGNVAIAQYYWKQIYQAVGNDQPMKEASGRWTDILMKQGDRWVLIADDGGKTSKD